MCRSGGRVAAVSAPSPLRRRPSSGPVCQSGGSVAAVAAPWTPRRRPWSWPVCRSGDSVADVAAPWRPRRRSSSGPVWWSSGSVAHHDSKTPAMVLVDALQCASVQPQHASEARPGAPSDTLPNAKSLPCCERACNHATLSRYRESILHINWRVVCRQVKSLERMGGNKNASHHYHSSGQTQRGRVSQTHSRLQLFSGMAVRSNDTRLAINGTVTMR